MTPVANSTGITRGPDGNLWFTETGTFPGSGNKIGELALVCNSDTVSARPLVETTVRFDAALGAPQQLQVQPTFNGTAQAWVPFATTGHAPGSPAFLSASSYCMNEKIPIYPVRSGSSSR